MPKRGPGQCRPCALSWTHRCYRDTVTGISGNLAVTALLSFREMTGQVSFQPHGTFSPPSPPPVSHSAGHPAPGPQQGLCRPAGAGQL